MSENQDAKKKVYDLDDMQMTDTAEFVVYHPVTGEETPWVWTVAGPGHAVTLKQKQRAIRKGMSRARVNSGLPSAEEVEQENTQFLVERVLDWRGGRRGGQELPFSAAVCAEILDDPKFAWLRAAYNNWLASDTSFMSRSAKS